MSEFEIVRFEVEDRIATTTLNRPERKNAMNQQLTDELRQCWRRVTLDPDVWVVILTGAGEAFSSGADVAGLAGGALPRARRDGPHQCAPRRVGAPRWPSRRGSACRWRRRKRSPRATGNRRTLRRPHGRVTGVRRKTSTAVAGPLGSAGRWS